jgi:UDP-N-acetylglucosamine/UDP-N-acetylgalactosamine diphosphorylase
MPTTHADLSALRARLTEIDQAHVLHFYDKLPSAAQSALLKQIASLELGNLPRLINEYVKCKPKADPHARIEPAPCYGIDGRAPTGTWDREQYRAKGIELISAGKVAAFTVAGGQGSRLGYDGPKGCFPGGAVTNKPLFACLAEWIIAAQRRWCKGNVRIPWYIMTSPLNHEPTVKFFHQHKFFGLDAHDVMFFPQGVMPSFDMLTGRMLLDQRDQLALSPDGHGGSLRALHTSGALDDMDKRGVSLISYTQIDNPLVRVIDPVFIGLHAHAPDSSGQMSSKMVPKAHAGEKVGVLCTVNGQRSIVEYSDMPAELSNATNADKTLKFNAGSIAVHIIATKFVRELNAGGRLSLPWHRAEKKVPYVDLLSGNRIEPTSNNAIKLETFVFDALPLAKSSIVMETERADEFAPIKNASGADSVETCKKMQTARAAKWLISAGCRVPISPDGSPNCTLEISPLRAMDCAHLRESSVPGVIAAGDSVAL